MYSENDCVSTKIKALIEAFVCALLHAVRERKTLNCALHFMNATAAAIEAKFSTQHTVRQH